MNPARYYLGFDIGGAKCATILGRDFGSGGLPEIVDKQVFPTVGYPEPDAALGKLLAQAALMTAQHGLDQAQISAAGISCGGPLDSATGMILSPPNLPGWDQVPVTERLAGTLRVPVRLQNDANACALAEWRWGSALGAKTAIFLTFGTGMGAGLIINGRLHEGADGLAGELGHWRLADEGPEGYGKAGSFEGFCSGGGMARLARQKVRAEWAAGRAVKFCSGETEWNQLDVRVLSEAARAEDPLAQEIFELTARQLGRGLALLIDLLNPDTIVLGSIYGRCEDLLKPAMQETLEAEALPASLRRCRIVPSTLGDHIGDYASLAVGLAPG